MYTHSDAILAACECQKKIDVVFTVNDVTIVTHKIKSQTSREHFSFSNYVIFNKCM